MMNRDDAIDQFFFEHYISKYIELMHGCTEQTERLLRAYRFILEAVMAMSVERSSANKLRAEVMLIISCMFKLNELSVEGILNDLSEDMRNEICQDIITLQTAVQHIIQFVPSTEFRAIHEKCLCQVDALKSFFENEESTSQPDIDELWSLLRELVLKASRFIKEPSECSCQVLQKMNGEILRERPSRISDLNEIMGKAPDESDTEEEIKALHEKVRLIQMKRWHSNDSSQEQMTCTSKKSSAVSTQGHAVAKKTRTATESESTSGSEDGNIAAESISGSEDGNIAAESISGSEDGNIAADENSTDENKTHKRKYPVLPSVKPRFSLLSFGQSRKPPSHLRLKQGKWSQTEEEEFIVKTLQIGEGKWAEIKAAMKSARSTVQLKDKWRIFSLSRVKKVARQNGLTYVGSKLKG